jgi:hypothetical protein
MTLKFALLIVLSVAFANCGAHGEEAKPRDVTIGPVTLQIVETESGEKELRHGTRVLVKDYSLNEGVAAKFKDTHARVFDVSPGGSACEAWPAVVTVDMHRRVAIDLTMKDVCRLFTISTDEAGFTLVETAVPERDGSVWRFTPDDGLRRLGVLVFRPQPKSTWDDLDNFLDHPLSLFNAAPFDAAVRKLVGPQFREFASRLHVAPRVKGRGERFVVGTGCQAHACKSDKGLSGLIAARARSSSR